MVRRLIITAGWLAAAVLAVLVGLVGVGVIRDEITAPITRPLSQAEVERELARTPPSPSVPAASPSPSPSRSGAAPTGAAPRSFPTRGGTVVARCVDGAAEIVSLSPAPGFEMHGDDEFRGVTDNHDRVKFDVSCDDDVPEISVESEDD
jgi:hypothetical protein